MWRCLICPEITAKESYTIGVAMTDVSTGWFKALYDHVNEKLTEAGVSSQSGSVQR